MMGKCDDRKNLKTKIHSTKYELYNKAKNAKHKIRHNGKKVYWDSHFTKAKNIHILYS